MPGLFDDTMRAYLLAAVLRRLDAPFRVPETGRRPVFADGVLDRLERLVASPLWSAPDAAGTGQGHGATPAVPSSA
ncbi:hypothetical protein ACI784_04795 [Geodermatophilus sp. SYSU D01186]